MNNFPTMTEERRQELLERCEEFIKQCGYGTHAEAMTEADGLDLLITQIALRALTAEPVAVLYSSGDVLTKEECADQRVFEICCRVETPLFDAPPAPVLRAPDGWIKCSERMPELDTKVLLLFTQYDNHIEDGFIGDEGDDVGWYHYLYDGDALQSNPTHWMPLPAPPEASNEQ